MHYAMMHDASTVVLGHMFLVVFEIRAVENQARHDPVFLARPFQMPGR